MNRGWVRVPTRLRVSRAPVPSAELISPPRGPYKPVLFRDDGHVIAYSRLSAKRLRKQLARVAP